DGLNCIINATAAEERGIKNNRIDHEWPRGIVGAHCETDAAVCSFRVAAGNRTLCPVDLLVDIGPMHGHRAARRRENEIAILFEVDPGPGEGQSDRSWVCSRVHDEVVLESALIAVIHDVDPWIYARVAYLRKGGDFSLPLRWVVTQEVVDF